MAFDFDLDAHGMVIVCPVTGFHVAPIAEIAVLARIAFARTPDQLGKVSEALQFGLTPELALQLAEDLQKTARHILSLPKPGRSN